MANVPSSLLPILLGLFAIPTLFGPSRYAARGLTPSLPRVAFGSRGRGALVTMSRGGARVRILRVQRHGGPQTDVSTGGQVRQQSFGFLRRSGNRAKRAASLALASVLVASATATAAAASLVVDPSVSLPAAPSTTPSYHLVRILFLRFLALVYVAAFSVAKSQNRGLIGDLGIVPARNALDAAHRRGEEMSARRREWLREREGYAATANESPLAKFARQCVDGAAMTAFRDKFWYRTDRMGRPLPTLLWLARDRSRLNPWLDGLANAGLAMAALMLATGAANVLLIAGLWIVQRSLMSVGGPFYGYGWELQLAELTFHALFLVPLLSLDPFFGSDIAAGGAMGGFPVPALVVWTVRWYLFKIMMGAGLIKVKSSDRKWKLGDMSAMDYFYETQPVPNPFSRYFHFMPKAWHRFEVWTNHFVELVAPFLLLAPFRSWRLAGGLIQIVFQFILISSGNLSFLNWLTLIPAIFCFDDAFLVNHMPNLMQKFTLGTPATHAYIQSITTGVLSPQKAPVIRAIVGATFFLLIAKLNVKVVQNLFARPQTMNGSFDKLRLVGTYGVFGVVAEKREELIVKSAHDINGPWKEYQFKVKPGDVMRRPRWISPYHHRLDWQLWIAAQTGRVERSLWILNFLLKLLRQEKDVLDLLESDPWKATSLERSQDNAAESKGNDECDGPPKFVCIDKYRYTFYNGRTGNAAERCSHQGKPPYWTRERVGRYFPRQGVMTAEMLEEALSSRR
ncbi:hypothetical protein ACHAWF_013840 [Thalassiosira exigua]